MNAFWILKFFRIFVWTRKNWRNQIMCVIEISSVYFWLWMLEYKVKETRVGKKKHFFLLEHEFETRNGDFGFIRPYELMVICDTLTISVTFFLLSRIQRHLVHCAPWANCFWCFLCFHLFLYFLLLLVLNLLRGWLGRGTLLLQLFCLTKRWKINRIDFWCSRSWRHHCVQITTWYHAIWW